MTHSPDSASEKGSLHASPTPETFTGPVSEQEKKRIYRKLDLNGGCSDHLLCSGRRRLTLPEVLPILALLYLWSFLDVSS